MKRMTTENSALMALYFKYEHFADIYASRIFNYEHLGLEKQDIVQEFKIKVYTTLIAYGEKVNNCKAKKQVPPVKLEIYLQSALSHKVTDMIREINRTSGALNSVERMQFDYTILRHDSESMINLGTKIPECQINGVDMLQGLTGFKRRCFVLFLKGYQIQFLNQMFKKHFKAGEVIREQIALLQPMKDLLYEGMSRRDLVYNYALTV